MEPIFIGGCERSGTTVLGAILGAHSDCLTIPEAYFKLNLFQNYARNHENFNSFDFIVGLQKELRFKIWQMETQVNSIGRNDIGNHPNDVMEFIVNRYGEKVDKLNCKFWVDHTPRNLVYPMTLLEFFPSAKMIHIIRDGRAVAASVLPLDWGPNTIDQAAYWWIESIAHGLNSESILCSSRILRVYYEDLIINSEASVKRICEFLKIDFQPGMLSANGFKLPSYTVAQHKLVGKKLDKSRVSAWETKLKNREIEIFERITGDFLQTLEYPLKYGNAASDITNSERQILRLNGACKTILNRVQRSIRFRSAIKNVD